MISSANLYEEPVLVRLASDDFDVIRSAAFEAGERKLKIAVDLLAGHLLSDNMGVQEAADFALRQIRGPEAVTSVAPLLRSEEAPIRNCAMDVLREIGADDMKTMTRLLHDEDADIRIFAADILGTSGARVAVTLLSEILLHDPEVNVRYQAGISLGTLGFPEADKTLSEALHDEEWVQFAAIEALTKIKADSCATILINAMKNASELVCSTIINALGEMGNVKAVPMLLKRLDVASGPLRNKTVKAIVQILGAPSLGFLGQKDLEKFRAYLLVAIDDEDDDVVEAVLLGLSVLGNDEGTRAVLNLAGRLDPMHDHDLLASALRCLTAIGYNAVLLESLYSENDEIRRMAVETCGKIADRHCVGALIEAFWTFDRDMQRTAAQYLAQTADIRDVKFFLEVLDKQPDSHVLKEALRFLGNTTKYIASASYLLRALDHPYNDVKEVALEACLALGDKEVNAQLTSLFSSPEPVKRMMATYAMGRIDVAEHLETLTDALEDEIPDIRKVALEAIGGVCTERPELLVRLSPRLADENREVRLALVEQLGQMPQEDATNLLMRGLEDEDDWVRIRVIEALGKRRLPDVVPRLVQMLDTSNLLVMLKIIEVLGAIGGNVAFRALLSLTNHDDPDVQQAVGDAIARIREEQGDE